jgi:putative transposase
MSMPGSATLEFLNDNDSAYRAHETHPIAMHLSGADTNQINKPVCSPQPNGMLDSL